MQAIYFLSALLNQGRSKEPVQAVAFRPGAEITLGIDELLGLGRKTCGRSLEGKIRLGGEEITDHRLIFFDFGGAGDVQHDAPWLQVRSGLLEH